MRLEELARTRAAGLTAFGLADWSGLRQIIDRSPPETAYFVLKHVGRFGPLGSRLDGLITGPDDKLGLAIAGAVVRERATRHRGLSVADMVSKGAWEKYLPALLSADDLLREALRVDPKYGLAAAYLMSSRIDALEEDKNDGEARLFAAENVPASGYLNLMMARSAKWGGSNDEMWSVARRCRYAAPPGSLACIARAHFETWLFHAAFDDSPRAATKALGYFNDLDVKKELREASQTAFNDPPQADIANTVLADNWLAMVLLRSSTPWSARKHLKRLGRLVDYTAWYLSPFPPRWQVNWARIFKALPPIL